MDTPRRVRLQATSDRSSVSPLELFFDLVFVFALTGVTGLIADDTSARSLIRGLLAMAVVWWCWIGYAWLGNVIRADEGFARVSLFFAMGAMFVVAVTIPEAFDDLPGGLPGPVVFAVGYFFVRLMHVVTFWLASAGDPQLRGQILRFVPSMATGTVLLLVASQLSGAAQTAMWVAALVGDYLGTLVGGEGWRLNSPSHFAERHGLIVIIALGESIVSIGVGVTHLPVSWPIIVGAMLGLAVSGLLWWAYFDTTTLAAERALAAATGERQIRLARGGYSFLHLPIVVGVVLLSVGLKKVLNYAGDDSHHSLTDPLHGLPLVALLAGPAVYLLGLAAFKAYVTGTMGAVNLLRISTAVVLLALIPVAGRLPALAALGLLAAVLLTLVSYETIRYAAHREQIRHGESPA
ncbi:low temperature requirement protein A [Rhodococcus kronopolitis]|uniref:Low temperature requirement protein A n=1 Tax=Rhodococcus kronopolitis TaxID=1460226 RepID=A0ABV9FYG7_9NOCA